MKCPECKAKMKRNSEVCPACDHTLTEDELKKAKKKRKRAIWIPLGVFFFFVIFVAFLVLLPVPYVEQITISNQNNEVEYEDSLYFTISCYNDGGLATSYKVPVCIDGELVKTISFDLPANSGQTLGVSIGPDLLPEPGVYTLAVEDTEAEIKLLDPAEFNVSLSTTDQAFAVGETYQLEFSVENTGPSSGDFVYTATFNGQPAGSDTMSLDAGEIKSNIAEVTSDTAGDFVLLINDVSFPVTFYNSAPYENGYYLMKNTVKGYSYIDITNDIGYDMVAYLVTTENPGTAVAARYIESGNRHKINSIVHGDYYLILQTGDKWIPELSRFGKDEKFYQSSWVISFDNKVYGGTGTYQYLPLPLSFFDLIYWFTPIDAPPELQ